MHMPATYLLRAENQHACTRASACVMKRTPEAWISSSSSRFARTKSVACGAEQRLATAKLAMCVYRLEHLGSSKPERTHERKLRPESATKAGPATGWMTMVRTRSNTGHTLAAGHVSKRCNTHNCSDVRLEASFDRCAESASRCCLSAAERRWFSCGFSSEVLQIIRTHPSSDAGGANAVCFSLGLGMLMPRTGVTSGSRSG